MDTTQKEKSKSKTKKYLKWYLYLFILVFVLSVSILLAQSKASYTSNPLIEAVNKSCYNSETIFKEWKGVEGRKYSLIKNDFRNGKYNCSIVDSTVKVNSVEKDYLNIS